MGIDYDGILLVGGYYGDIQPIIEKMLDTEEFEDYGIDEILGHLGLDAAFPYFDSGFEVAYIGFRMPTTVVKDDWYVAFEKAAKDWEEITGVPARIMGVQHIY